MSNLLRYKLSNVYWLNKKKQCNMITIKHLKNIAFDIKSDDSWVNDSHSGAEHKGICDGLDRLINHRFLYALHLNDYLSPKSHLTLYQMLCF